MGGRRDEKHPKTKTSDIEVQSFGHNSETNQDIKIRNSNLKSPMNYKVKDIKMTLNLFDLDLHRIAHLSNIQNFGDENLYNFLNINFISLHLEGFLFNTTSSIFSRNFIKIGSVVCSKYQKKRA